MTTHLDIESRLIRARTALLLQQPFWGTLAMRLKFLDVTDQGWLSTMAVDGRTVFYNSEFVDRLSSDELVFLIAHEVAHVVYDHVNPARKGQRDPRLWNQAIDYVVNLELSNNSIGKFPNPETCGIQGCLDQEFAGMFAEQVYEILHARPQPPANECFDEHRVLSAEDGSELSDQELDALKEELRSAIIQAARAAGTASVPSMIRSALAAMSAPRINWREVLRSQIKSSLKSDYTWMRRSKKSCGTGVWLPSTQHQQQVHVAVAVDCSGSVSDGALKDLISEVGGIMREFDDFRVDLWCFDTEVWNHQTFTPQTAHELAGYELTGGGGTTFECNWEYMRAHDLHPEKFIMMTDGYNGGASWGDPDWCNTIFVIHGDSARSIRAPHGITIHHDMETK